jgi:hypothetical protein
MSDTVLACADDVILIIFSRQHGESGFENETERVILKKFQQCSNFSEISQHVEVRFVTFSLQFELPPFTTLHKHIRISTPAMGAFQTLHCRLIDR